MNRRPYTLIEVLVALLVTAIVIPIALKALMTVGLLDQSAANRRRATDLASLKLNELVVTGDWNDGDSAGDFGDDYPGFSWELVTDSWSDNTLSLRQLDLTVSGPARFGRTTVTLTTLVPEPAE